MQYDRDNNGTSTYFGLGSVHACVHGLVNDGHNTPYTTTTVNLNTQTTNTAGSYSKAACASAAVLSAVEGQGSSQAKLSEGRFRLTCTCESRRRPYATQPHCPPSERLDVRADRVSGFKKRKTENEARL